MKEETRKVVILDWKDKIKLQEVIKDLKQVADGYKSVCKDSPRIEKEIESISIGKPKKGLCPDKWLDTEFFIIKFK